LRKIIRPSYGELFCQWIKIMATCLTRSDREFRKYCRSGEMFGREGVEKGNTMVRVMKGLRLVMLNGGSHNGILG
jgi:hypothetical protein